VLLSMSLLLVIFARTSLYLYTHASRTVSLYHAFTVTSHLQLHGQLSVVVGERYQHTASCLRLVARTRIYHASLDSPLGPWTGVISVCLLHSRRVCLFAKFAINAELPNLVEPSGRCENQLDHVHRAR
jgi:hypothetical protein